MNKNNKATILVVDDTPDNLLLISGLLKDIYTVKTANSGQRCLEILNGNVEPDLILLDIMMPEMDGYEVCRKIKKNLTTKEIPIIFLTAKSNIEDESLGLELGAVDYITKPISPPILLARVKNHLALKASADFLRNQNEFLEQEIQIRIQDMLAIQDATIHFVMSLAETRDPETGNHIRRTQLYVKKLAEKLSQLPRYKAILTSQYIQLLYKSAPLHDIGKIGIPDKILLKPGRFTPEEFEIMKTHTTIGYEAIIRAEKQLGIKVEFLELAKQIALGHQEKWDGSGYPLGLAGEDIPLSARLMALADVYDALISRRVYKEGMPHEVALDIMRQGRGNHFDPDVLDVFLEIEGEIREIANRYADTDKDVASKHQSMMRFSAD